MDCFVCSATNLTELAKAVKMLAALSDSDQDRGNLLAAAQALAEATAKLLNSSKPENIEVSKKNLRCTDCLLVWIVTLNEWIVCSTMYTLNVS